MVIENNMQNITPLIDYRKIAEAKDFYEKCGFKEIAVPWIIDYEAYNATRPTDRKEFYTLGGYLNASGEQSFLELLLQGKKLTKNMCITSCFRCEPELDFIHHYYFVKLELIDMNVSKKNLHSIIEVSKKLFNLYMPSNKSVKVIQTDKKGEMFDIVDPIHNIELGSYGIRRYKKFKWIYGTGIALPRLDTVLAKLKS